MASDDEHKKAASIDDEYRSLSNLAYTAGRDAAYRGRELEAARRGVLSGRTQPFAPAPLFQEKTPVSSGLDWVKRHPLFAGTSIPPIYSWSKGLAPRQSAIPDWLKNAPWNRR